MAQMTKLQFEELLESNLKKYFKKEKFNNIPQETINKFTTVNPSLNNFNIIDEYNKTLSKKDDTKYNSVMDKEKDDEFKIIKEEKKKVIKEMKEDTSSKEYSTSSNKYSKSSNKYNTPSK